eukprot:479269-Hanusia_phi.AAC.1
MLEFRQGGQSHCAPSFLTTSKRQKLLEAEEDLAQPAPVTQREKGSHRRSGSSQRIPALLNFATSSQRRRLSCRWRGEQGTIALERERALDVELARSLDRSSPSASLKLDDTGRGSERVRESSSSRWLGESWRPSARSPPLAGLPTSYALTALPRQAKEDQLREEEELYKSRFLTLTLQRS